MSEGSQYSTPVQWFVKRLLSFLGVRQNIYFLWYEGCGLPTIVLALTTFASLSAGSNPLPRSLTLKPSPSGRGNKAEGRILGGRGDALALQK